ncbi:extensin [Polistes fuscatus]|uniref:extensin n=1 Tax=Polistes fuscatus TaxID=30207 RepID=UPI001CAA1A75|nr:extensin [Polistes fuscatus]
MQSACWRTRGRASRSFRGTRSDLVYKTTSFSYSAITPILLSFHQSFNMFVVQTLISLAYFAVLTSCQYQREHQQAAILSDARYLSGDGTFGAAYTQEDGVEFKEESDVNGDRRGSYSYVDPTGQRRTVTYTAGKNGFQASGDHIPVPPAQTPPQPEYVPLPEYNPPDYKPPAAQVPAYRTPPPPPPPVYRPAPPTTQYQTRAEPEYDPRAVYQAHQPQPQYQYRPQARYTSPEIQSIPSFSPRPQYQPTVPGTPIQRYNDITNPPASPNRFYPPGKLSFNRTPDGFSYTFSKS